MGAGAHPPFELGRDTAIQPDQAQEYPPYVEELISFATGKDADGKPLLTTGDLSRILGKRRAVSKATNNDYSLRFIHRLFSSSKYVVFSFTATPSARQTLIL